MLVLVGCCVVAVGVVGEVDDVLLLGVDPTETVVDGALLPKTPDEHDHPPLIGSQSTRGAMQDAS